MAIPLKKEIREEIARMYEAGSAYTEIQETIGCSTNAIIKVVEDFKLKPRRPGRKREKSEEPTKKTNVEKICPKCRKPIEVHGARFCPWCGADVRSERQIVAEELERVLGVVCDVNVPADSKDRACNTLRNAIRLLKEEPVE